jgi:hypothetical protein
VLSSAAMVDLYSQIYSNDDVQDDPAERALLLRDAYVGAAPADRVKAMQSLWDGAKTPDRRYGRLVLTAYAAARLPAEASFAPESGDLIAAMLAAGLDGNAARWRQAVEAGSDGWAQLIVGLPMPGEIDTGALTAFRNHDASAKQHRSALLVAGLSGLGRISDSVRGSELDKISASIGGRTRWTDAIDSAAAAGNPALVALLAGLGMQGDSWSKMTPRYLYHIVAALNHGPVCRGADDRRRGGGAGMSEPGPAIAAFSPCWRRSAGGGQHAGRLSPRSGGAEAEIGDLEGADAAALGRLAAAWATLSPASVARKASALRQFFGFLVDEGWRGDDPSPALPSVSPRRPAAHSGA